MLSKSKIMKGLQCPKALYLSIHQKALAQPVSASQEAIFDQGHLVGIEAQRHFPGGILIDASPLELNKAIEQTKTSIQAGALVLYEATFVHDDVLVRVDILHRPKLGAPWKIHEVKSTTEVKPQHIEDAAIQAWVLRGAGERVESVAIMHINNECVWPDSSRLFKSVDISKEVEGMSAGLPAVIGKLKKVVASKAAPALDIGPHCSDPYECEFMAHCWGEKKIPELSVFDIPGFKTTRKWELYRKGILDLSQLASDEKLTATQRKMVEVSISGERYLNRAAIARELKPWKYPFYFLDFETIAPAIPLYAGTRPYQQIPFQWSCHALEKPNGELKHFEYLHQTKSDPREPLVCALLDAIGEAGTVIAYNKAFEATRVTEMARALPQYADRLLDLAERLVDPLPIFRSSVYDPEFRGSFSVKSVAPALLGDEYSYEGMAIGNGTEAQVGFLELISDSTSADRRQQVRAAMLEYCRRDTLVMVKLVAWLEASRVVVEVS